MLKTQQRLRSERDNDFTEKISKFAFLSDNDKRMQAIDSLEMYAYGTSKDIVSEKERIKCNNIIKR